MRTLTLLLVGVIGLTAAAPCQETPGEQMGRASVEACSVDKNPRLFCDLHQRPFEPIEVPIAYGFPAGEVTTVGLFEHGCRRRIEKPILFPQAAPESVDGGCVVLDDRTTSIQCKCPSCTAAERHWEGTYNTRDDVTPYHPSLPAPGDTDLETGLFLRIQELRAFGDNEVADCLQEAWDRRYGNE